MLSSLLLHFFIPSFRVSIIAVIVILEYVLHLEAINALFSFKEKSKKKKKILTSLKHFLLPTFHLKELLSLIMEIG